MSKMVTQRTDAPLGLWSLGLTGVQGRWPWLCECMALWAEGGCQWNQAFAVGSWSPPFWRMADGSQLIQPQSMRLHPWGQSSLPARRAIRSNSQGRRPWTCNRQTEQAPTGRPFDTRPMASALFHLKTNPHAAIALPSLVTLGL